MAQLPSLDELITQVCIDNNITLEMVDIIKADILEFFNDNMDQDKIDKDALKHVPLKTILKQ